MTGYEMPSPSSTAVAGPRESHKLISMEEPACKSESLLCSSGSSVTQITETH